MIVGFLLFKVWIQLFISMQIKENNFEGAPGGIGMSNGQPGYGTFASPSTSQNPGHFSQNDNNKAVNQYGNTRKDAPGTSSLDTDMKAIWSKKATPTPDEVASGIKYELGQQLKKDKFEAKRIVLANLRKDPQFYSGLKMLGIDDGEIENMSNEKQHPNDKPLNEKVTVNADEAKKIFTELAKEKDHKYVVNSGIVSVMKEMWAAKRQRNAWRTGE